MSDMNILDKIREVTKLLEKENGLTPTKIAKKLHMDKRTIDKILKIMQNWGTIKIEELMLDNNRKIQKIILKENYKEIKVPISKIVSLTEMK